MKNSYITIDIRKLRISLKWILLFLLAIPSCLLSQESNTEGYRTITAYINDFAKNELYVKKSLMEYSSSIIEPQLESRSKATSNKIVEKLKAINTNLRANDKGYEKNTLLKDSFIRMNEKTIECMTNGTLIMDDYELQSLNSVGQITQNLKQRELNLINYFAELKRYEKCKKEFGNMYSIQIKTNSGNNVFEYNALENVLFYKINVIDEKINASINKINGVDFSESIAAMETINQEIILKTNIYKSTIKDTSLNNATILYSNFILNQKMKIISLFIAFSNEYSVLQNLKNQENQENDAFVTQYNVVVKSYNTKKNTLFDALDIIQKNKKIMYDNWLLVNRTFLKNNANLDDLYQSYTYIN